MLLLLAALAAADETCTVKVVEPSCVELPVPGDPVPEAADPLGLLAVPRASWVDSAGAAATSGAAAAPSAPPPDPLDAATRARVNAVLERGSAPIFDCVPFAAGARTDLRLRFVLPSQGGRAEASLPSSLGSATVDACVVDAASALTFPPTGTVGPVALTVTLSMETTSASAVRPSGLTPRREDPTSLR